MPRQGVASKEKSEGRLSGGRIRAVLRGVQENRERRAERRWHKHAQDRLVAGCGAVGFHTIGWITAKMEKNRQKN